MPKNPFENPVSQPDQTEKREKQQVFPDVPEKFTDGYPEGYRPWPKGWSFTVDKMKEKLPDGTYKMLTLDMSIPSAELAEKVNSIPTREERAVAIGKFYTCKHNCPRCFSKTMALEDSDCFILTWDENKKIIDQAAELGLETVKFLEPGELLDDPDLFKYLDYFKEKNINFSIFTKPAYLTDEVEVKKKFGLSPKEFLAKIKGYENVSLLVSFTSADPETEKKLVESSVEDYSNKRNQILEMMAELGFNDDPDNQRMALICAPVLKSNIDEAFDIFKWGIKRNIPVVLAPTMVSGRGAEAEEIKSIDFKDRQLVDLWVELYDWLIKEKLMTMEQIEQEGVSPYAGFACNQFISGMFIRMNGQVQGCPGNETQKFRHARDIKVGDREIPTGRLEEVWKNSVSYEMRKELIEDGEITLTQACYAKTGGLKLLKKHDDALVPKDKGSFSEDFYARVLETIKAKHTAETVE
ncbi:MAG: radical SAM protein [Patescibacteria group bacterium]